MNWLTHFMAGLIIGKLTNNYVYAILGSLLVDFDHLFSFIKHKVKLTGIVKLLLSPIDPYSDQRSIFHNILVPIVGVIVSIYFDTRNFVVFFFAYTTHLVFDMLDKSNYYPFYPNLFCIKGIIKYLSIQEHIFTFILLILYFIL